MGVAKVDPAGTPPKRETIRVLGVDPGLNTTGYGVLEIVGLNRFQLVEAGVIRTPAKQSIEQRLCELHRGVAEVLESLKPHTVALEQLYTHYERPTTAILMGHARGVICLAAAQAGLAVHHYPANRVKKLLTGMGIVPKRRCNRLFACN